MNAIPAIFRMVCYLLLPESQRNPYAIEQAMPIKRNLNQIQSDAAIRIT
jgi:hypothetical protein